MPVVIKRSETGGAGNKPDKGAAKSPKNTSAKGAPKTKQGKGAGLSLKDQRVKIIGLSTIIIVSLLFIAWWMGWLGGSEATPAPQSNGVNRSASRVAGSPGAAATPGATLGTKAAGMGAAPGGRMGGGFAPDDTGAAGTPVNGNTASQGEGIP